MTLLDQQCGRRTCKYLPYCHTHLKKKLGLVVKTSRNENAGLGLFAARNFDRGDIICVYYGELLTKGAVDDRYGSSTGPYSIQSSHYGTVVDGACLRSPAVYANDLSNRSSRRPRESAYNAQFEEVDVAEIDKVHGQGIGSRAGTLVCLVATKRITASPDNLAEINVNYGRGYWMSEGAYAHRTKQYRQTRAVELSAEHDRLSPPYSVQSKKSKTGSKGKQSKGKSKKSKNKSKKSKSKSKKSKSKSKKSKKSKK